MLNTANVLTLSRIAAIPLVVACFWLDKGWSQWISMALFVLAGITDVLMNTYAVESASLRAQKIGNESACDMTTVLIADSMDTIEATARTVLAACSEGDTLRTNFAVLRRFAKRDAVNTIGLRRKIAQRLIAAGAYKLA